MWSRVQVIWPVRIDTTLAAAALALAGGRRVGQRVDCWPMSARKFDRQARPPRRMQEVFAHLSAGLDDAMTELAMAAGDSRPGRQCQRFKAFSAWQADWARQGWRIEHVKQVPKRARPRGWSTASRCTCGPDRPDRRRRTATGRFDYKFSDRVLSPEQTHRKKQADRPPAALMPPPGNRPGISGPVELGYIVLPKTPAASARCWPTDRGRPA